MYHILQTYSPMIVGCNIKGAINFSFLTYRGYDDMRKEFLPQIVKLWLAYHTICSSFLPHSFKYGLDCKGAGKVDGHLVRHVVTNSIDSNERLYKFGRPPRVYVPQILQASDVTNFLFIHLHYHESKAYL